MPIVACAGDPPIHGALVLGGCDFALVRLHCDGERRPLGERRELPLHRYGTDAKPGSYRIEAFRGIATTARGTYG